MAFLALRDISMAFAGKGNGSFLAIDNVSFSVERNEFVCLIGHSGCGKSTLLNLIAGLILPSAGEISCEGAKIRGPGPDRAMVFQSHALLPWMTCFENVYLGVEQVPCTAFVGVNFYVMAMTAGSLLPAMVAHAIADLVSGDLGYRALATDAAGTGADRVARDSTADSEGSARPPVHDLDSLV